jgi:outer membrane protein OmpA-like peptidoglycan-associated protein
MQLGRLIFGIVLSCLPVVSGVAQEPSSDDIINALKPRTLPQGEGGITPGVRSLRGLEVLPSDEPQKAPSIDLYVNFKFDSAELEPDALQSLRSLAVALRSPELKDAKIMIVGHTDAKGSDDYNMKLSQRRAAAVRSALIGSYEIESGRLQANGRGESELKDTSRPEDGINRRVEIRNVTTKSLQ